MSEKKVYAVVGANHDLLDYIEAPGPKEALEALIENWGLSGADADALRGEGYAIPAEKVLDSVRIPGGLLSAIEYGAQYAGLEPDTHEWDEYQAALNALQRVKGDIVGWVRVNEALDLWSPVTL